MAAEQLNPNPEIRQPQEIYDAVCAALLGRGTYKSDAHYLYGDVLLLSDDSGEIPGHYKISDYHASSSSNFIFDPEWPRGADPEKQRRLLEASDTIIGIQFYDQADNILPKNYLLCWPDHIRPDSIIGMTFYPDFHGPKTKPAVPSWSRDEPTIVRFDRLPDGGKASVIRSLDEEASVIRSLDEDPQLQLLIQKLK